MEIGIKPMLWDIVRYGSSYHARCTNLKGKRAGEICAAPDGFGIGVGSIQTGWWVGE